MEITKEELGQLIETAVGKAIKAHTCVFTTEEKQTLKDVAFGGKTFKRMIIYVVVAVLLIGMGLKYIPEALKVVK